MNRVILKCTTFPMYSLSRPTPDDPGVDIPDALLERIERATVEFSEVQNILYDLYKGG